MNTKSKAGLSDIKNKAKGVLATLSKYKTLIFLIFIIAMYGYVFMKINNYSNVQPSQTAVSGNVKTISIPHIDENVITQINSLKDNSVNVQSLFDQTRTNPFQ